MHAHAPNRGDHPTEQGEQSEYCTHTTCLVMDLLLLYHLTALSANSVRYDRCPGTGIADIECSFLPEAKLSAHSWPGERDGYTNSSASHAKIRGGTCSVKYHAQDSSCIFGCNTTCISGKERLKCMRSPYSCPRRKQPADDHLQNILRVTSSEPLRFSSVMLQQI
eukprot:scpid88898/ scgid10277/ 